MPGRDATGPMGMGPMTGRGMGNCARIVRPADGQGYGRGLSCRRGAGRNSRRSGRGFGPAAAVYGAADEKSLLQNQAELLKSQLDAINDRLNNLNTED